MFLNYDRNKVRIVKNRVRLRGPNLWAAMWWTTWAQSILSFMTFFHGQILKDFRF